MKQHQKWDIKKCDDKKRSPTKHHTKHRDPRSKFDIFRVHLLNSPQKTNVPDYTPTGSYMNYYQFQTATSGVPYPYAYIPYQHLNTMMYDVNSSYQLHSTVDPVSMGFTYDNSNEKSYQYNNPLYYSPIAMPTLDQQQQQQNSTTFDQQQQPILPTFDQQQNSLTFDQQQQPILPTFNQQQQRNSPTFDQQQQPSLPTFNQQQQQQNLPKFSQPVTQTFHQPQQTQQTIPFVPPNNYNAQQNQPTNINNNRWAVDLKTANEMRLLQEKINNVERGLQNLQQTMRTMEARNEISSDKLKSSSSNICKNNLCQKSSFNTENFDRLLLMFKEICKSMEKDKMAKSVAIVSKCESYTPTSHLSVVEENIDKNKMGQRLDQLETLIQQIEQLERDLNHQMLSCIQLK